MFLPPFVINDIHPVRTDSETIDWGVRILKVPEIHAEFGLTGKGVRVAVIGTWIDPNHEDLAGNIVESYNVTSEAIPTPQTQNGHENGSGGCTGARKNDGGVLGVAPECSIIAIKALSESGSGNMDDIAKAINMAIDKGVQVINLSLGGSGSSPALKASVERANAAGIYVIASAGNSGTDNSVGFPAKYPTVYAVGATNQSGRVSAFSSRGNEVDIAAPGERILTCWKNNTYATVSGTSFSSPIVAGCFALFVQAGIKMSFDILKETSIDIEEIGQDVRSGYGLINPYAIIKKYYKPVITHCDTPNNVNVGSITPTSFQLVWEPVGSPDTITYVINYRETTSTMWKVQDAGASFQTVSGLRPGVTYEVKVQAVCGEIKSDFSPVFQVVTGNKPIDTTKVRAAYDLLDSFLRENNG